MNLQEAIHSIHQTLDQIIATTKDMSPELLMWKPAEDKWSVMEVLAHVEEAIPYWLDEINRLIERPGTEWGRGLQDEKRLAAIAMAGSRSLDEVLSSLENIKGQVAEVLNTIPKEALLREAPSRNPRFGIKPLTFVIEHLLVEHVDTHVKQIKRNLDEYLAANRT